MASLLFQLKPQPYRQFLAYKSMAQYDHSLSHLGIDGQPHYGRGMQNQGMSPLEASPAHLHQG